MRVYFASPCGSNAGWHIATGREKTHTPFALHVRSTMGEAVAQRPFHSETSLGRRQNAHFASVRSATARLLRPATRQHMSMLLVAMVHDQCGFRHVQ
jgi:hypothetical protein